MSTELENIKSENAFLKAEVERLKVQVQTNAYKTMFESSPDIIIQLDKLNRILIIYRPDVSKEHLESMKGQDIFDVTPIEFHESMQSAFKTVLQEGKVIQYYSEGDVLGGYRYYDNYASPIFDETGTVASVYFRSREVTAQKKRKKFYWTVNAN